jgi:hypothetical protein
MNHRIIPSKGITIKSKGMVINVSAVEWVVFKLVFENNSIEELDRVP